MTYIKQILTAVIVVAFLAGSAGAWEQPRVKKPGMRTFNHPATTSNVWDDQLVTSSAVVDSSALFIGEMEGDLAVAVSLPNTQVANTEGYITVTYQLSADGENFYFPYDPDDTDCYIVGEFYHGAAPTAATLVTEGSWAAASSGVTDQGAPTLTFLRKIAGIDCAPYIRFNAINAVAHGCLIDLIAIGR